LSFRDQPDDFERHTRVHDGCDFAGVRLVSVAFLGDRHRPNPAWAAFVAPTAVAANPGPKAAITHPASSRNAPIDDT
jgi:hypothetical protein